MVVSVRALHRMGAAACAASTPSIPHQHRCDGVWRVHLACMSPGAAQQWRASKASRPQLDGQQHGAWGRMHAGEQARTLCRQLLAVVRAPHREALEGATAGHTSAHRERCWGNRGACIGGLRKQNVPPCACSPTSPVGQALHQHLIQHMVDHFGEERHACLAPRLWQRGLSAAATRDS